ncbi:MAG: ATP-binding protein [Ferruginibacter sp.]
MYATVSEIIIFFVILCSVLILFLSSFVIWVVFKYQKKQSAYLNEINVLKAVHENAILLTQIEIQEQTFQNISRDIHDNIGQKLSLAKLLLINDQKENDSKGNNVVNIITESINDLRNLSRTLSSERVLSNGFIEAVDFEIEQLKKVSSYNIELHILGEKIFLENGKELILFRIIQESLQNIIKHSEADKIVMTVKYSSESIDVRICDNGKGFNEHIVMGQGLHNMQARTKTLGGEFIIFSNERSGTTLNLIIPINQDASI